MNKTERTQQPTLAMINFVGMSVCAVLIFTIFLGENIMLPVRLCMGFCLVATATLMAIGEKHLWLMVGGAVSAVALMTVNPVGALAYLAYCAGMFLFFRFNPTCEEYMKEWVKGIFASEKEAKA